MGEQFSEHGSKISDLEQIVPPGMRTVFSTRQELTGEQVERVLDVAQFLVQEIRGEFNLYPNTHIVPDRKEESFALKPGLPIHLIHECDPTFGHCVYLIYDDMGVTPPKGRGFDGNYRIGYTVGDDGNPGLIFVQQAFVNPRMRYAGPYAYNTAVFPTDKIPLEGYFISYSDGSENAGDMLLPDHNADIKPRDGEVDYRLNIQPMGLLTTAYEIFKNDLQSLG